MIRHATDTDSGYIEELFWEYLCWANGSVNEKYGVNFDIASMIERDMANLAIFSPPDGRLVLALDGDVVSGLGCLKRLVGPIGEIKRLYVKPSSRGTGLGKALVGELLAEAARIGYSSVRLDSAGFMNEAHALYRSFGFTEIEPYAESEVPADFQQHWIFMEKAIAP